jgi:hypothetical protein
MIARVARAYGRPPLAVARGPFAETAWAFAQLVTLERFDAIARDGEGLQAANRAAIAFHAPQKLEGERQGFLERLRGRPRVSANEAKARARKLIESGAMNDVTNAEPIQ